MRNALKFLANSLALLCVSPCLVCYCIAALLQGKSPALAGVSQLLSLLPGTTGVYLRRAFYRCTLAECGEGSVISFGVLLTHANTTCGDMVYIGPYCVLGDVGMERDVLIGSHVSITNGNRQHGIERLDLPVREQLGQWPRVTIGCDTWIGDRAVIMANVGQHCVVGAGAVVTKPVPDFAIVVGVPAHIVGWRKAPAGSEQTAAPLSSAGEK
jgi:virginiamycin A acetyltransferase